MTTNQNSPETNEPESRFGLLVCCLACLVLIFGCSTNQVSNSPQQQSTLLYATPTTLVSSSVNKEPIRPLVAPSNLIRSQVMLGKSLFHDPRLSHDNTISCASCHNISAGGDDGRPVAIGITRQLGLLNTPTVLNSSLSIAQFWDGRAKNLSEQIHSPIHNSTEMGSNWKEVISKLRNDPTLAARFQQAFHSEISPATVAAAIVSYEKALVTIDAPFDLYLKGNTEAISDDAIEGYRLFKSIGCISCHQGKTVGGNMFQEFGILGSHKNRFGLTSKSSKGRFNVTGRAVDLQRFKVPSLRNVERTAPYFHNGSVPNLIDAIEIMAEHQLGEPIEDREAQLIHAFLVSLNGSIPAELQ